jgi:hypothetical protein
MYALDSHRSRQEADCKSGGKTVAGTEAERATTRDSAGGDRDKFPENRRKPMTNIREWHAEKKRRLRIEAFWMSERYSNKS